MIKYPQQYNQFIDECKREGLIVRGNESEEDSTTDE
jgi:hypothetical protein